MSQENVEVVRRAFEALGDSQPEDLTDDALKDLVDPDIEWVPVPRGFSLAVDTGDTKAAFRRGLLPPGTNFASSPRNTARRATRSWSF